MSSGSAPCAPLSRARLVQYCNLNATHCIYTLLGALVLMVEPYRETTSDLTQEVYLDDPIAW